MLSAGVQRLTRMLSGSKLANLLLTESIKPPLHLRSRAQTLSRRVDKIASGSSPPLSPNFNVEGVVGQAGGDEKFEMYHHSFALFFFC